MLSYRERAEEPTPAKPETCALCGNAREWHRNPGRSGVHKFAERLGDLNALKPEAPKQDRARQIAAMAATFSPATIERAIRAYGDEQRTDEKDYWRRVRIEADERWRAALAAEKERAETYRASRDTAEAGYKLAESEVTRLREVLGRIQALSGAKVVAGDAGALDFAEIARLCREAKGGSDAKAE